jgi:DNA (cytosine-5)-methyltransferase 1
VKKILAADLFCGAGGTTSGLEYACVDLGLSLDVIGINHWDKAIETFRLNHPRARHLCETLDSVNPRIVIPGGRLDLLVASPECIDHSPAKGGKPLSEQGRASAWHVPRWLDALQVDGLIVENVPRFMKWGPLGATGRPIKSRRGETFKAWLHAIEAHGYRVEYRTLIAADYGDATTRERLFVQARKGRKHIDWPTPSHGERPDSLFGRVLPWRPASEIIDWSLNGRSIYNRPKPLTAKTLARIAEGIRRFWGEPFVLAQAGGGVARSVKCPLPTITTDGAVRIIEPFVVTMRNHTSPRTVDHPLTTIATSGNHHLLVEAFIACYYGTTNVHRVTEPLPTITTKDRFQLVEPVVVDGKMLDIRVRMFETHELARATSLDPYWFAGNKTEQKKQIGNAVPRRLATALCRSYLEDRAA